MREGSVAIGPKPLVYLMLFAAMALGALLFIYAPDPLTLIDAGARPDKSLAIVKWGGGLLALVGLWRLYMLKRVRAGPEGIVISSGLRRARHDWSALRSFSLEGRPIEYALRFGAGSITLRRSDYAERDIAALRAVVKAHRG